jgi:hypothetical protein
MIAESTSSAWERLLNIVTIIASIRNSDSANGPSRNCPVVSCFSASPRKLWLDFVAVGEITEARGGNAWAGATPAMLALASAAPILCRRRPARASDGSAQRSLE